MKKMTHRSLLLIAAFLFILRALPVLAATATPAATPTSDKTKQIEDLKERLATKVAELRQTQKKAIFGSVKSVSITSATIETATKDIKIELPDEIKVVQYLKGIRTTLAISDLEKGDMVAVFGTYDATLDLMSAQFIFIQAPPPLRVAGTVTAIDKVAFTLTVTTAEGQPWTIDIERYTKTNAWSGATGIAKSGFSKIVVGDSVHITGTATPKKDNRMSADRILDLGNLTGAPAPSPTATPTPEATSSAQPTTKATPKPTPTRSPTP